MGFTPREDGNVEVGKSNVRPVLDQLDEQPAAADLKVSASPSVDGQQEVAKPPIVEEAANLNQGSGIGQSQVLSNDQARHVAEMIKQGAKPEEVAAFLAQNVKIEAISSEQADPAPEPVIGNLTADQIAQLDGTHNIEVIALLGSGGHADVYLVRNRNFSESESGEHQALKLISPTANQKVNARFDRELIAAHIIDLKDPDKNTDRKIVVPNHVGQLSDGARFYTMPVMEGGALSSHNDMIAKDPVFRKRAMEGMVGVLESLDYLHSELNVIHRDLKPANLLLTAATVMGEGPLDVRIADFGIAKSLPDGAYEKLLGFEPKTNSLTEEVELVRIDITSPGGAIGTPHYASPEQISGIGSVDGRTDQYAAGVVLYRMATGQFPHPGRDVQRIMIDTVSKPAPDPLSLDDSLDQELSAVIQRMLAKNPEDRFATAREAAQALQAALDKLPANGNFIPR